METVEIQWPHPTFQADVSLTPKLTNRQWGAKTNQIRNPLHLQIWFQKSKGIMNMFYPTGYKIREDAMT